MNEDVCRSGKMVKDGQEWAVIQIFDQQFIHLMDESYSEEAFIMQIKHDLVNDWLVKLVGPAGYMTNEEFDPWKAVYPERTGRAVNPVYMVKE